MNFLKKILNFLELEKFYYKKVILTKKVAADICEFAKKSYPLEFISYLKGEKINENLIIKGLIYQEFKANKNSAFSKMNLPLLSEVVGTVHSHPSYSNLPSRTDLKLFNKQFGIHLIISYPFLLKNIQAYNPKGKKILLNIKQKL